MNKKTLSFPYLFWAGAFIVIPLCMVFYYGITDKTGAFTLENIVTIATQEHCKALILSIELSLISTILCFLLAYPLAMILTGMEVNTQLYCFYFYSSYVDEFSSAYPCLADTAGKNRCY